MSTTRIAAKANRTALDGSKPMRRLRACSARMTVTTCSPGMERSHVKVSGVQRLDLLALRLDGDRIVLHHLDLAQRLSPRLVLDQRMDRAQAADVDHELLGLDREHVALEQDR